MRRHQRPIVRTAKVVVSWSTPTHALQTRGKLADALRGPAQGRHRVARGSRLHQALEIGQKGRIFVDGPLAAPARTSIRPGASGRIVFNSWSPR